MALPGSSLTWSMMIKSITFCVVWGGGKGGKVRGGNEVGGKVCSE
jgi:hypothetical protein